MPAVIRLHSFTERRRQLKLKWYALLALICFVAVGCGSNPIRRIEGKRYASDIPPLEIDFSYQIVHVKERGNDRRLTLNTTEVRDIYVGLDHIQVVDHKIDFFYSVERIVKNNNFKFYGPVYFNDHQWAKVSKVNDNGWLMCGYFTRKDKWIIFVHNSARLTNTEMERYTEYQRTLKLDDTDKQFIEKLFAELDKGITSIR